MNSTSSCIMLKNGPTDFIYERVYIMYERAKPVFQLLWKMISSYKNIEQTRSKPNLHITKPLTKHLERFSMEVNNSEVTDLSRITKVTKNILNLMVFLKDWICRYITLYLHTPLVFYDILNSFMTQSLSYGNQYIDLQKKPIDWFL